MKNKYNSFLSSEWWKHLKDMRKQTRSYIQKQKRLLRKSLMEYEQCEKDFESFVKSFY